jgi:endoglucanase
MIFATLLPALLLSTLSSALPQTKRTATLPLSTNGRDIIDASGNVFHFASTNWPGHQEVMIPEGLQHASIQDIVSWFPKFGLNSVRMTFAIEMIDDYLNNTPNQTLEKSFTNSLGEANGTIVLDQILEKNPEFTKNTTRLEVWDAVAKELSKQGVIIHLDNHVSKAFWCCADNDGNGWFGEKFFDVEKWKRGLAFMADHVSSGDNVTHFTNSQSAG